MRLDKKVAIVIGAGQTPGETIGNGRATALLFAREGAKVFLVDRDESSVMETKALIDGEGGDCETFVADITRESECEALVHACQERYGSIDVLHNNVGIGVGDNNIVSFDSDGWDRIMQVNLKGMAFSCKHALPVMREQQSGSIINISSIAAVISPISNQIAYRISKAGVNTLTHAIAMSGAKYGIRANAIMPGLMETPMAIEGYVEFGVDREELIRRRNDMVPLGRKMGTGWDIAYAALYLASEEARFVTGVILPVDGGQSARIG